MGITKQRIEEANNPDNYDEIVGWTNGINSINQSKRHKSCNITPKYSHMMNYLDEYDNFSYDYIRYYIKEKPYKYRLSVAMKEIESLKIKNKNLKKNLEIVKEFKELMERL